MRRAIWMALAFMGTAPLVALARQQNTGEAPAASPQDAEMRDISVTPGEPEPDAPEPVTVATAVFDGRVVGVTPGHIDIIDTSDGAFYRLTLDDQTRAFVGPELERIPVERISEGTPVRTSFALISGVEHARNIVVQPQRR